MRTQSQCMKIHKFMEKNGSITAKDAMMFGCMRLAARIADLKHKGYPIESRMIDVINADGSHSRVAEYSLVQ